MKWLLVSLLLLLTAQSCSASWYQNPYTGKPDYYESGGTATDVTISTTNFNNNLSSADDTLQEALDTIDNFDISLTLQQVSDYGATTTNTLEAAGWNTTRVAGQAQYSYWYEYPANGDHYVGFQAPTALAGSIIWTLPDADSAGAFTSNGSGTVTLVDYVTAGEIDTAAELDTIVADANLLIETEIDASSELLALMDDETGSASGSPLLVFNVNPTLTGATLAGILADNDDMVFECDADNDGTNKYSFTDGASTEIASISEAGALQIDSNLTIGANGAADHTITFDSDTNDIVLTWMEDEAEFKSVFGGDLIYTLNDSSTSTPSVTLRLQRGAWQTDSYTDHEFVSSGGVLTLNGYYDNSGLVTYNLLRVSGADAAIEPGTDNTYYLGKNDDDTPYAWKGLILKDTTNGKYYRIEVINGSITATDLTD